jgi:hypothetical protein
MMQLKELLKGCMPVRDKQGNIMIQTILNMQLVCLTTKPEFSIDEFENPLSVLADTSRGYGNLTIHNTTNKPIIIPPQSAYLTDYPAQRWMIPVVWNHPSLVPSVPMTGYAAKCCLFI